MTKEECKGIWVFAEQENGVLSGTDFELLAKAHDLKAKLGGTDTVTAVLLGGNVSGLADTLYAYGAEQVILAEHPNLAQYSARPYEKVLVELASKHKPSIFLFAASPIGRDVAPRVMCALRTGLTADAIDLDVDEDGVFVQTTPNFGGNILSHIVILEKRPQMVTVHPKVFEPLEPRAGASGELITESVEVEADDGYVVLETSMKKFEGKPIDECDVLVAGGRGIKSEEDLAQLRELAELLGGELACSRPLNDNGWMPHEDQIGQSGTTVKPKFILNVAISGSVQYLAGMQNSGCIMSINHTASAPIYDVSHYGAVMDYRRVIPALIAEIKARKAKQ
ncbi:MAG TPA: electron transfer flavoprotein subunit alpha/FixB family protein [Candidatus Scatomorpha stercoravium]|nr:electron transfer flavoprotein subunit alpha/FixB family protein [Candidatus Scatomorpha stercoravium]